MSQLTPLKTSLFDLNVEKVLEDWDVSHGLREVIANALDERNLTGTAPVQIFRDESSVWHVKDFGRGITYRHLTQNENDEKLKNAQLVIGKFGVGLKDALATFDRKGIQLVIKSGHGDITIEKATKHLFDQVVTLHARISPPSQPDMLGSEFIFANIREEDIQAAKSLFLEFSKETVLEKTQFGEIISRKSGSPSRIYVNGLKLAEEENFLFSYNITSLTAAMRKALNRERSNVGRTAYSSRVKSILLACENEEVKKNLVADLQQHHTGGMHDELKWLEISEHATRILSSSSRKAVFLTSEQLFSARHLTDEAVSRGEHIVIVPDRVADRIRGGTDLSGNTIRNLEQYVVERRESFQFRYVDPAHLSAQERRVFDCTDKIFRLIGGRPARVERILISETMRPGDPFHTLGLWDGKQITIMRSQLASLEQYSSTLIHEACHALSGAHDVSREFELQLTMILGKLAIQVLNPVQQLDEEGLDLLPAVEVEDERAVEPPTKRPRLEEKGMY